MDFDEKTLILGIGAQKTGTSWLYSYLSRRPDIFMSPQKELHYFDVKYQPDLCYWLLKRYKKKAKKLKKRKKLRARQRKKLRGLKMRLKFRDEDLAYREYFRTQVPEQIDYYGEITPSYALLPEEGFRAIRNLFPKIRIVFIMRDPVERFYSHVRHNLGKKKSRSHEEIIRRKLTNPEFIERSSYQNTIRKLEAVFAESEIVYLFYETMFKKKAIRKLCRAIGIEYQRSELNRVVHSSGPRQQISRELYDEVKTILEPTYSFCRDRFGDDLPEAWGHYSGATDDKSIGGIADVQQPAGEPEAVEPPAN